MKPRSVPPLHRKNAHGGSGVVFRWTSCGSHGCWVSCLDVRAAPCWGGVRGPGLGPLSTCTSTQEETLLAWFYPIKDSHWVTAPRSAQHPLHHPSHVRLRREGRRTEDQCPSADNQGQHRDGRALTPCLGTRLGRTDSHRRARERVGERERLGRAAWLQHQCMI